MRRFVLALVLLLVATPLWGQAPVPLAEIAGQLEQAEARLETLEARPAAPPPDTELAEEVTALGGETRQLLGSDPTLSQVRELEERWGELRTRLKPQQAALTQAATALDADARELAVQLTLWEATLASAREEVPPELLERLTGFPTRLLATRVVLETRRSELLKRQSQLSQLETQAKEALASLAQLRSEAVERVFMQDDPPLWSPAAYASDRAPVENAFQTQLVATEEYVVTHRGNLFAHVGLVALVALLLAQVKRKTLQWGEARSLIVFQAPLTMALILGLFLLDDLYPDSPRLFNALLIAVALLPSARLLNRLLGPDFTPLLALLIGNFLVDQVRFTLEPVPLLERLVFLGQLGGCALFLGVLLWLQRRQSTLYRLACWLAAATFGVAALACLTGYLGLADLLGTTALKSGYLALLLAAILYILDSLVMLALVLPPLSLLSFVQHDRLLLRRRVRLLLTLALAWIWLDYVLDKLTLLDPVQEALASLLTSGLHVGELDVRVGDLLAFALVMLVAAWLSRFLRFVLDQDVYTRVDLPRGLPYALSAILHYSVLVAGFLVAMTALGVDTGRFAVVAGALSVGIGFGLQNIVNNFVSGLILLFERPVKVGDSVKVGAQAGQLLRVGLRASVVRTWEGSEVIVPNGQFISQEVTNWSAAPRRFEIKLGVPTGSDPERVLEQLLTTAQTHPEVVDPEALFLELGDTSLLFQLRATATTGAWARVRSELLVALHKALPSPQEPS